MWQRDFRKNSADSMGVIAQKLDDQEIAAIGAGEAAEALCAGRAG